MTIYLLLFGAALLIITTSLVGKIATWKICGNFFEKNTKFLSTFAGGVFLVISFSLIKESLHTTNEITLTVLGLIAGAIVIEMLTHIIANAHHHHTKSDCTHKHSQADAHRMLMSDAIHNIGDGIMLVPAFFASIHIGIVATIGILLHEIVQELSEFFVLRQAGYSIRRAIVLNLLVSTTIILGIIIGIIFVSIGTFNGFILAFSAGGFLMILLRDIIPHTIHAIHHSGKAHTHILLFLFGAALMLSTTLIAPHEHTDANHDMHTKESLLKV